MATTLPPHMTHCVELLSPLGPVSARRMFGGHGLWADGLFVGLVLGRQLYLKTDDMTRPQFEAAGGRPFTFEARGRVNTTGFWTPPDDAMESAEAMQPWGRLAFAAALRAAAKPKKKTPAARKTVRA